MRSSGAVLIIIAILALGFVGLSWQGQAVQDTAVDNGTNTSAAAYNMTEGITEIVGPTTVMILVYGGLALMAFMAVGLILVYASRGGGR